MLVTFQANDYNVRVAWYGGREVHLQVFDPAKVEDAPYWRDVDVSSVSEWWSQPKPPSLDQVASHAQDVLDRHNV